MFDLAKAPTVVNRGYFRETAGGRHLFHSDLPRSLILSLALEKRYPRGFSVHRAASQFAVFARPGYTVHLTDPQRARFSFDAEQ
jgi:hypothetical protein